MDLSELVTSDNAENGVWTQAVIYGKKQNFEICILGADADAVILYNREKEKEAQKLVSTLFTSKKTEESIKETAKDIKKERAEDAVVRICGLRSLDNEPLMLQGTELKCDKSSYRLLCTKIPDVIPFVVNFSNARLNFLSQKKKN